MMMKELAKRSIKLCLCLPPLCIRANQKTNRQFIPEIEEQVKRGYNFCAQPCVHEMRQLKREGLTSE
jgi:hypothetical protein